MSGQIVDSSLIATPKRCNIKEEKDAIKAGRIPLDLGFLSRFVG